MSDTTGDIKIYEKYYQVSIDKQRCCKCWSASILINVKMTDVNQNVV